MKYGVGFGILVDHIEEMADEDWWERKGAFRCLVSIRLILDSGRNNQRKRKFIERRERKLNKWERNCSRSKRQ